MILKKSSKKGKTSTGVHANGSCDRAASSTLLLGINSTGSKRKEGVFVLKNNRIP